MSSHYEILSSIYHPCLYNAVYCVLTGCNALDMYSQRSKLKQSEATSEERTLEKCTCIIKIGLHKVQSCGLCSRNILEIVLQLIHAYRPHAAVQ